MATIDVVDVSSKKVKSMKISDEIFAGEVNDALLYSIITWQLAKRRSGNASTLTRAEVTHSTKKPFKQKGTGRARQGMTSSPLFPGGGIIFGPKPRDYTFKLNRKARDSALRSALTQKFKNGKVVVLDSLNLPEIKTKEVKKALDALKINEALIVDGKNENLYRSAKNLRSVKYLNVDGLNVYDILNYEHLVITEKSLNDLSVRLAKEAKKA